MKQCGLFNVFFTQGVPEWCCELPHRTRRRPVREGARLYGNTDRFPAGPPVRSTLKSTLRKSLQKACQYASLTRHKNSPTCTLPNRYSEVRTDARVRRVSGCLPGLARIDRALDKQRNRFLRLRQRTRSRRRPRQLCCLAVRPPAALAVHAASSTAGACSPASAAHSAP